MYCSNCSDRLKWLDPNDLVLIGIFATSGTTLVACEKCDTVIVNENNSFTGENKGSYVANISYSELLTKKEKEEVKKSENQD